MGTTSCGVAGVAVHAFSMVICSDQFWNACWLSGTELGKPGGVGRGAALAGIWNAGGQPGAVSAAVAPAPPRDRRRGGPCGDKSDSFMRSLPCASSVDRVLVDRSPFAQGTSAEK